MTEQKPPRDAGNWAAKVDRLEVSLEHTEAGYNVSGRRVTGPQQGFGRLWQRRYATTVGAGVTPEQLIANWKQNFGAYWPPGATFHTALTGGLTPGEVAPIGINAAPGMKLATGILVLYADDESFSFMTPEGHMFAGMITFAAAEVDAVTEASITILIRPNDPLYELGWPVMRRKEDAFWSATLRNLAAAHGAPDAVVTEHTECVDKKRLWSNWRNVRHNAGIRSFIHTFTKPFRRSKTS
jgi:hypothetical protein